MYFKFSSGLYVQCLSLFMAVIKPENVRLFYLIGLGINQNIFYKVVIAAQYMSTWFRRIYCFQNWSLNTFPDGTNI